MRIAIYIVAGLVALAIVGLVAIVMIPNRSLPDVPTWQIGQGSRGGLGNAIISGL